MPYRYNQAKGYYEIELIGDTEAERHKDFSRNLFGTKSWEEGIHKYGWQTTINGQYLPLLVMGTGELERWRLIHAGVREHTRLEIVNADPSAMVFKLTSKALEELQTVQPGATEALVPSHVAAQLRPLINQSVTGEAAFIDVLKATIGETATRQYRTALVQAAEEVIPLHQIALDGLATGKVDKQPWADLFPGYRIDALVQIKRAGIYFVLDAGVRRGQGGMQPLFSGDEAEKVMAAIAVVDSVEHVPPRFVKTRLFDPRRPRDVPPSHYFARYKAHDTLVGQAVSGKEQSVRAHLVERLSAGSATRVDVQGVYPDG